MSSTSPLNAAPTLSSLGVGSGLNIQGIIQKLMAAQSQPLTALQKTQSNYQAQLSAYGQLTSALSTFESAMQGFSDPTQFQAYTATSSQQSAFTATADSSAVPGNYQVAVSNLAHAQTDVSKGFADSNTTTVGSTGDQMTVTVGSNSMTVTIGGQTLQQIADAINSDSSNPGVTATVINTGASTNPYELMLTANQSGSAGAFSVTSTNASDLSLTTPQTAQNASLTVNGVSVSSSSNTVTGAIPGVTLNLLGATSGTASLAVTQDQSGVTSAVQNFVSAYNSLQGTITKLQGGALSNDPTMQMIQSMLYDVLNTPVTNSGSSYTYLASAGLTIQQDGTMAVNTQMLDQALSSDPAGVANLFAQYATNFQNLGSQLTAPNGLTAIQQQGLNSEISNVQDQITQMQNYLNSYQQNLTKQYTALDTLVNSLNNTGSYLTKQLASLPTSFG